LPIIKQNTNATLLDIGCGVNYSFLREVDPFIKEGYGIDFKVPNIADGKIKIIKAKLIGNLPFNDNTFDFVTMLAVLEHLEFPEKIMKEIERILKPKGTLIITVPSKYSKPILELFACKLKIVSIVEVKDHKLYYNYIDLKKIFKKTDYLKIYKHEYFEFFMNNFCVVRKEIKNNAYKN